MSRLVIDVTGEQHQKIKAMASLTGKSIKDYVLERILPSEENAWEELKVLLEERITSAEKSEPARQSFEEVVQEIVNKNSS